MPAFVLGEKWDVNYFMPAVILWWDTVMCGQTNVAFAIVDVKQMVDVVYKVLIFILLFARLKKKCSFSFCKQQKQRIEMDEIHSKLGLRYSEFYYIIDTY